MAEETKPIEITLGDGSVVKAADMEEAFRTVAKMKEDTAAALAEATRQRETLEQQLEQERLRNVQPQPQPQNQNQPYTIGDPNQWWAKAATNPVEAIYDAIGAGFGVPGSAIKQELQFMSQNTRQLNSEVSEFRQQAVAATFQAMHPEYDITNRGNHDYMGAKMEEFANQNIPFSREAMELAYSMGVREGKIKTVPQNNNNNNQQQEREEPNPSLGGRGGRVDTGSPQSEAEAFGSIPDWQTMPIDKLQTLMRSKGVKGI